MWRVPERYSKRRFRIFAPSRFAGMLEVALPVAAIVECEDVEPRIVQTRKGIDCVAKIAVCAMEVDSGERSPAERGSTSRGVAGRPLCLLAKPIDSNGRFTLAGVLVIAEVGW